jgi:phosphatidyl-myo-inositol alpha-mannosyltransferase
MYAGTQLAGILTGLFRRGRGGDASRRGRLKIAHVTPYDLAVRGGVNASAVEFVRRQRELGHQVDLIGSASADPAERAALPPWRRVDSWIVRVPANGSVAALAVPRSPGPDGDVAAILAAGRYDVLVYHEPALPLAGAVLGLSTAANVGTMHAFSEPLRLPPSLTDLAGLWLSRLHRTIAVSSAAAAFAASYLDVPYTIIPNGIEVPKPAPGRPAPGPGASPGVLFLGRPEPRKGLDVLLEAFRLLRRSVPRARLLVAGDGTPEQWAPYQDRARRLGILEATSFLGRVGEPEKRALFASAAVYASPATGGESQGVVLLESMALGTPVVASDIPGYRTVITPGRDGLLVPPGDPEGLADAFRRVLGDPGLAGRLAAAGRATVERQYDWRVVLPRHLSVYREAIAAAARPAEPAAAMAAA